MPDLPEKFYDQFQKASRAAIAQAQEDARRQLRVAGLPEQRIFAAIRQIEAACRAALHELDAISAEFQELARYPRDPELARLMQERIAFYQRLIDTAVADIVTTVIRNAINEFQHPPAPQQPIIAVTPASPGLPAWLDDFLHTAASLVLKATWLAGFVAGLILSWFTGAPLFWAIFWSGVTVVATALLWDWVGSHVWSLPIPLVAIGVFCVAVF